MATIAPRRQEDGGAKKPVVNFSRLRRDTESADSEEKEVVVQDGRKDSTVKHPDLEELIKAAYHDDRNVKPIQAYKSNDGKAMPDEPRFSTDTLSTIASVAELQDTSRHDSQTLPDEPIFFTGNDSPQGPPTSDVIAELPDTSKDSRIETGSIIELPSPAPSTTSASSTSTQFRWQGRDETLRDESRLPTPTKAPPRPKTPTTPLKSILRKPHVRTNTSTSSDTISPPSSSSSSTAPLKSILKHTTVEQYSEAGEDEGSHHITSEGSTSRNGSVDSSGKWSSSDFDTSQLSEKELKKLEKKGINPALYLEMKAAKGGKRSGPFGGLGSLTGNAYVS